MYLDSKIKKAFFNFFKQTRLKLYINKMSKKAIIIFYPILELFGYYSYFNNL